MGLTIVLYFLYFEIFIHNSTKLPCCFTDDIVNYFYLVIMTFFNYFIVNISTRSRSRNVAGVN